MQRIDIAMTPAEARGLARADCYLVIDALRATTTMAVLFSRGLRRLLVVEDIAQARSERAREGVLLFGEEGGLRPEGFDYGNSPAEAAGLDVAGREAVHVTSNGTRALCSVADLGTTVAAAYVNLSAAAAFAARFERVVIVCAGNGGATRFSLEDFAVAAAYVQELAPGTGGAVLGDAAQLATRLTDPAGLIEKSEHAAVTRSLGFEADLEFATRRDAAPSVPLVTEYGPGWCALAAGSV